MRISSSPCYQADGTAEGTVTGEALGPPAILLRQLLAQVPHVTSTSGPAGTLKYTATFRVDNAADFSGSGALRFELPSIGSNTGTTPNFYTLRYPKPQHDFISAGLTDTWTYVVHLPSTVEVSAVPGDQHEHNAIARYGATYRVHDHTIIAERRLQSDATPNVCPPAIYDAVRPIDLSVARDFNRQFLFAPR